MTHTCTTHPVPALADRMPEWRQRHKERRRLARQDLLTAQLVDLHRIHTVLVDARALVDNGWVRDTWFTYDDEHGRHRAVSAFDAHRIGEYPITSACLVGAIVMAGGGLAEIHSQPVQRALDLTWHTLFADVGETVRWCPAPSIRTMQVRELTRWNDHPHRTQRQVSDLLQAAEVAAHTEIAQCRHRLHRTADVPAR
jgi:hypothetical protein